MQYLIFSSIEDAMERNDQAGEDKGLPYHNGNGITRYPWGILEEGGDNRAALEIEDASNLLTEQEKGQLVAELPEDWQFPVDP
tara:strand:- start:366 stop:614 length:249 start_codon:yes stop_codon:yes gene_type:complete